MEGNFAAGELNENQIFINYRSTFKISLYKLLQSYMVLKPSQSYRQREPFHELELFIRYKKREAPSGERYNLTFHENQY